MLAAEYEFLAPKPGNVSRVSWGKNKTVYDFAKSSIFLAEATKMAEEAPLGEAILWGATRIWEEVGKNTHLGMLLTFCPIAKAKGDLRSKEEICAKVPEVLKECKGEEAAKVVRAVRIFSPPMKEIEEKDLDVYNPKVEEEIIRRELDLLSWFKAGEKGSVIARELVRGFPETLHVADFIYSQPGDLEEKILKAAVHFLARNLDSHLEAEIGREFAEEVSRRCKEIEERGYPREEILALDMELRERGGNPGSTADVIGTALFLIFLERGLNALRSFDLFRGRALFHRNRHSGDEGEDLLRI